MSAENKTNLEKRVVELPGIKSVAYLIPDPDGDPGKGVTIECSTLTDEYKNEEVKGGRRCIIVQGEQPLNIRVDEGEEETLQPGEGIIISIGASFTIKPAEKGQKVDLLYILPDQLI